MSVTTWNPGEKWTAARANTKIEAPVLLFELATEVTSAWEDALGNPAGNGYVLTSTTAGVRSWTDPASLGFVNPMTTAEDIIKGGSAGAPTRLAKGADGTVLGVVAGVVGWTTMTGFDTSANYNTTGDWTFAGTVGSLALAKHTPMATGSVNVGIKGTDFTTGGGASVEFTKTAGGSNEMHFWTHHTGVSMARRMSIDLDGNISMVGTLQTGNSIGIGKAPAAGLEVYHVSAAEARLTVGGFGVGESAALTFASDATLVGFVKMVSDSSTNIDMVFSAWKANVATEFMRYDAETGYLGVTKSMTVGEDIHLTRTSSAPYIVSSSTTLDLNIRTAGTGMIVFQPNTGTGKVQVGVSGNQVGLTTYGLLNALATAGSGTTSIIELGHTNGTVGIGLGYNTIQMVGSLTNLDMTILPKGTGTLTLGGGTNVVAVPGAAVLSSTLAVTGAATLSGTATTIGSHTVRNDGQAQLIAASYSSTAGLGAAWSTNRYRGTFAAATTVATGDVVGYFAANAYDGTALRQVALIRADVETYTTTDNVSGALVFFTRPTGVAAADTERMRIAASGLVTVAGQTTLTGEVGVGGAPVGGVSFTITNPTDAGFRLVKSNATASTAQFSCDGALHIYSGSGTDVTYLRGANLYFLNRAAGATYGRVSASGLAVGTGTYSTFSTLGITINQGTADDEVLAFKSDDVAHGMTTLADTNTYASFKKYHATNGGLLYRGLSNGSVGLFFVGTHATDDATRTTTSVAQIVLGTSTKSGTGEAAPGTNANIVAIYSLNAARFLFDTEGDLHADATLNANAYDGYDDVALVRTLDRERSLAGLVRSRFDDYLTYNRRTLEAAKIATFNDGPGDDGSVFVNVMGLQRLHSGAIWQLGTRLWSLEEKVEDELTLAQRRIVELEKKVAWLEHGLMVGAN